MTNEITVGEPIRGSPFENLKVSRSIGNSEFAVTILIF